MFYISSVGHSATGWLSKALSMHPKIVCWHGTRSIPPYKSGINDISGINFIEGLMQSEKSCFNEKVFGGCHGFYGDILFDKVNKCNGSFLWVVRNPLKRINSIFSAYIAPTITDNLLPPDTKINIYELIQNNETQINNEFDNVNNSLTNQKDLINNLRNYLSSKDLLWIVKNTGMSKAYSKYAEITKHIYKKKITRRMEQNRKYNSFSNQADLINNVKKDNLVKKIISTFILACNKTLNPDKQLFATCGNKGLIKMEEMVTSQEYFNNNIFKIILQAEASDNYLNEVFNQRDHINIHSVKNTSNNGIFELWPKTFQDHFLHLLEDIEVKDLYKSLDYELP